MIERAGGRAAAAALAVAGSAPSTRSRAGSSWAAQTNHTSKPLGGNATPASSRAWKNGGCRHVSLARGAAKSLTQRSAAPAPKNTETRLPAACTRCGTPAASPAGLAVLRLLAAADGAVVPRSEVLAVLPGSSQDPHAAEVAIARLREATGSRELIRTVVKRGYRLELAGVG